MALILPQPNSDALAVAAQGDISRLFEVVVFPAVERLASSAIVVASWEGFEAPLMDDPQFGFGGGDLTPPYASAAMLTEVHEALVQETHRGFALILGATFERHIRTWLIGKDPRGRYDILSETWRELTDRIARVVGVDLRAVDRLTADIYELWEVVSATRHGDGSAATTLAKIAPHLWPTPELLLQARSADLRVRPSDLLRYYGAVLVCWAELRASPCPEQLARKGPPVGAEVTT